MDWDRIKINRACKKILKGTVQGRRRREKKHWKKYIFKCTGLRFCDALREAKNRIKWRLRVAKFVVFQRSPWPSKSQPFSRQRVSKPLSYRFQILQAQKWEYEFLKFEAFYKKKIPMTPSFYCFNIILESIGNINRNQKNLQKEKFSVHANVLFFQ